MVTGAVFIAGAALAQTSVAQPPVAAADTETEFKRIQQDGLDRTRGIQADPTSSSVYALPLPQISLQTTSDGGVASAVIGVSNPFWSFRTTFKAPIGKEADAESTP